jgi:hypothetical protein
MEIALTAALVVLSIFSILFAVRRYQAATPKHRPQIVWAGCGAFAIAAGVISLFAFR